MYYFINNSGNIGLLFPGGYCINEVSDSDNNDGGGAYPLYYSISNTTSADKKFQDKNDFMLCLQNFEIKTYDGTSYSGTHRSGLDRSNDSTPLYGTTNTASGNRYKINSVELFYNGTRINT